MRFGRAYISAWLVAEAFVLTGSVAPAAVPRASGAGEIVRRVAGGDASAAAEIEPLLEPLFARKDLWTAEADAVARETGRLFGSEGSGAVIRWFSLSEGERPLRLLTIDFGAAGGSAAASKGYTAYAVVERARSGDPSVSWYHDVGRRIDEQGGAPWHPVGARLLSSAAGGPATILVEASTSSGGPAAGLLVLEHRGGDWQAARRIAPPAGARLLGAGALGAVFIADRPPPKGVLTGAPPGLFRSLILYDRGAEGFVIDPATAPVQDVVSIAEALIAALRRGDKDEAARLCVSSDVVEQMLYFTPGWKGGGRIVKAGPKSLEFVYEEAGRPSLRLDLLFSNEGGTLKLASATGRGEGAKP